MRVDVEPNADPDVAENLEREAGLTRVGREVARRFDVHPEGHFVARSPDGEVAGAVSCIVYGPAPASEPVAWIGGLVVRESSRGHGIAGRLLDAALAHAEAAGATVVGLDASADAVPLYERRGFRPVAEVDEWQRAPGDVRPVPAPAGSAAVYPVSFSELLEVSDFDAPRFGASRAKLVAQLLADYPERAFLAYDRATGRCVGLAMGSERGVGPLTAESPEVAARLLYACEQAGTPARADVLSVNPAAADVFRAAGYVRDGDVCTRMLRGADALPGLPEDLFAVGSPAMG